VARGVSSAVSREAVPMHSHRWPWQSRTRWSSPNSHVVEAGPILRSAESSGKNASAMVRVARASSMDVSESRTDRQQSTVGRARGKAKHGEQKVVAVRPVDPTGAEDQIASAGLLDGLLSGQLGCAVDIERVRLIGLNPWLLLLSVKNIISGIVDKQGIQPESLFGQDARAVR